MYQHTMIRWVWVVVGDVEMMRAGLTWFNTFLTKSVYNGTDVDLSSLIILARYTPMFTRLFSPPVVRESPLPFTPGKQQFQRGNRTFLAANWKNEDFVAGRKRYPRDYDPDMPSSIKSLIGALCCSGWFIAGLWSTEREAIMAAWMGEGSLFESMFFLIIVTAVCGGVIWVTVNDLRKSIARKRSLIGAQVLQGEIVSVEVVKKQTYYDSDGDLIDPSHGHFTYRFRTPDGQELSGTYKFSSGSHIYKKEPPVGTLLLIWYWGQQRHELL